LQTEKFEFYILHRDDESKPVDEIVEVLNELKSAGTITYFGGSNWKMYRIRQANAYAKAHGLTGFTALSPNFSMTPLAHDLWGGSVTISGDGNQDYRAWLEETQYPVFNYSALARGYLSGRYHPAAGAAIEECLGSVPIGEYDCPDNRARLDRAFALAEKKNCSPTQLALAWLLNQKMNLFPIVSPGSSKHMEENMDAFKINLTEEEMEWLVTTDTLMQSLIV
jgi:aryl-alcohol dehydrogenase-like predicted oxidoreductase